MLAALSRKSNYDSIIKPCLHHLRLSLFSKNPNSPITPSRISTHEILPIPIISLLPVLFNSKCAEIASSSIEIVGAASLFSFEMNEQIASDGEIVQGLISALACTKRNVSMAACNAVLDLSTTSIGRQRLLEFSAVENLIFCFIQVPESSNAFVSLFSKENGSETCFRIGFKGDDFFVLLLHATVTLVNACTIEHLEKIPSKLSETFLVYLKKLWAKVHQQMLLGAIQKISQQRQFNLSNIRTNTLAESIFRLSINAGIFNASSNFKEVKRSIFGMAETSFEHFILNYWEVSPLLMKRPPKGLTKQDNIFDSFLQSLKSKEAVPCFLSSVLQNLTSCLPIASDELNIFSFLNEVRDQLGCPIIYQQDIRVLKTQPSERERHFFQEHSGSWCLQGPHFLYMDHILRCEEAYKEGFTFSLRGMEFRFESIAAITDGLASLFGQPSAGANMYLTPPNSQGLACHCDDHCVFVCQLIGVKKWTIFPKLSDQLPRLYEPVHSWHDLDVASPVMNGCKQVFLEEGDILYIPRGFPHEACTVFNNDGTDGTPGFSLHLTLAIEVEPPFEWEGFAHVALHHWDQKQKQSERTFGDSFSWHLYVMSVNLIHVAIKLIGDLDSTFRKACLVGAISLGSVPEGWLNMSQRMIFKHLISKIRNWSRFSDVLKVVEKAIQKDESPFQQPRWLQHLNKDGKIIGQNWNIPSVGSESYIHLFDQHKDEAEAVFMQVKSRFCSEVVFEDVEQSYEMLLRKYKKARNQYMNGMLSLHCNGP